MGWLVAKMEKATRCALYAQIRPPIARVRRARRLLIQRTKGEWREMTASAGLFEIAFIRSARGICFYRSIVKRQSISDY